MKVGVIGGGAWGTALAQVAAANGDEVLLWAREAEVVRSINAGHENAAFLPGIRLGSTVRATSDLDDLGNCGIWLVVTPAQHMRAVLAQVPSGARRLILCSKGIEEGSGQLLHAVARQVCPDADVMVLSGPTFAHEVAAGLPTALTLAADDLSAAEEVRARLALPHFRLYLSDDVAGAEVGGAVKNVLAIACGVVEGRGLGQNARAALIARGFAEMTRFGLAMGAQRETLAGLCGLGDLVLTCSSSSSRNFSLGLGIGRGQSAGELMGDRQTVAEGAFTAPVLNRLARERGINMPIVAAVTALLEGEARIDEVLGALLSRPPRMEAH